jgi:hypothetical protein
MTGIRRTQPEQLHELGSRLSMRFSRSGELFDALDSAVLDTALHGRPARRAGADEASSAAVS